MFVEPRDKNEPKGVTLDKPLSHPEPKRALASVMAEEQSEGEGGGMGALGATPQIRALSGLKQVEMGFRSLVTIMPDIATQLGDLMSQLQPLVVAKVAQMTTGMGPSVPPGIMQPPPMAPPAAPPQAGPMPPQGM